MTELSYLHYKALQIWNASIDPLTLWYEQLVSKIKSSIRSLKRDLSNMVEAMRSHFEDPRS